MKKYFLRNRFSFLLVLIAVISEVLANPLGEFPLNDDWSFAKSVLILQKEHRLDLGVWPAMSLVTQLFWGLLFTKTFGFSLAVLRVSTIVSSIIGILVLNRIINTISGNRKLAFISSLIVLFNPLYFNLSNTFMTDVNFNTLVIISCYFALQFFLTNKLLYLLPFFISSVLLVLLRQFGVIVPLCFVFACCFSERKKLLSVGLSILIVIGVMAALRSYEEYLRPLLAEGNQYKFSGTITPFKKTFWDHLIISLETRTPIVIQHILFYTFPVTLMFAVILARRFRWTYICIIFLCSCWTGYLLYDHKFPSGNVFVNLSLGSETFYQSLNANSLSPFEHTYSAAFEQIVSFFKLVFTTVSAFTCLLALSFLVKYKRLTIEPAAVFFVTTFLAYIFLVFVSETFLDRYHILMITLFPVLMAFVPLSYKVDFRLAILPLLLFAFVSLAGTRDYLTLNAKKWEAYAHLRNVEKIPKEQINGGFEVNCWSEGEKSDWWLFLDLSRFNYLIQYRTEPGFEPVRVYSFQRFLSFRKDTVFIYRRTQQLR